MAINFNELLTPEQKKEIAIQRIQEFAAQAYQITINKSVIEQTEENEDNKQELIARADKDLSVLEVAINQYQAEISSLGDV